MNFDIRAEPGKPIEITVDFSPGVDSLVLNGWCRVFRDGHHEMLSEKEQRMWINDKAQRLAIDIDPGSMR